jgi:hypothetical protein
MGLPACHKCAIGVPFFLSDIDHIVYDVVFKLIDISIFPVPTSQYLIATVIATSGLLFVVVAATVNETSRQRSATIVATPYTFAAIMGTTHKQILLPTTSKYATQDFVVAATHLTQIYYGYRNIFVVICFTVYGTIATQPSKRRSCSDTTKTFLEYSYMYSTRPKNAMQYALDSA